MCFSKFVDFFYIKRLYPSARLFIVRDGNLINTQFGNCKEFTDHPHFTSIYCLLHMLTLRIYNISNCTLFQENYQFETAHGVKIAVPSATEAKFNTKIPSLLSSCTAIDTTMNLFAKIVRAQRDDPLWTCFEGKVNDPKGWKLILKAIRMTVELYLLVLNGTIGDATKCIKIYVEFNTNSIYKPLHKPPISTSGL